MNFHKNEQLWKKGPAVVVTVVLHFTQNLVSKSDKDRLVKASPLLIHKVKYAIRKQQKV